MAFFHSTLADILRGIHPECMIWVDDLLTLGETQEEMVDSLGLAIGNLQGRDPYIAALKYRFFAMAVKWCSHLSW